MELPAAERMDHGLSPEAFPVLRLHQRFAEEGRVFGARVGVVSGQENFAEVAGQPRMISEVSEVLPELGEIGRAELVELEVACDAVVRERTPSGALGRTCRSWFLGGRRDWLVRSVSLFPE